MITDWQFEIDDGVNTLALGLGTPYRVFDFEHGKADLRENASERAREDGTNRGRDYLGSTTAVFEIGIDGHGDPDTVLDATAALRRIWRGDNVRLEPSARAVLRAKRPGREIVCTFGRPGSFKPGSLTHAGVGYVPVVAEFDCDDDLFYSDTVYTDSIPFIPAEWTGLTGTLTGPWITSASGTPFAGLNVGGEVPTWLGWQANGPITNPQIELAGLWSATLLGSIASDTGVRVDPSPWVRSARRVNDGANWAGKLSATSERMSRMKIPPGVSQVLMRGSDPTGSSSLDLFWRSAWASY